MAEDLWEKAGDRLEMLLVARYGGVICLGNDVALFSEGAAESSPKSSVKTVQRNSYCTGADLLRIA